MLKKKTWLNLHSMRCRLRFNFLTFRFCYPQKNYFTIAFISAVIVNTAKCAQQTTVRFVCACECTHTFTHSDISQPPNFSGFPACCLPRGQKIQFRGVPKWKIKAHLKNQNHFKVYLTTWQIINYFNPEIFLIAWHKGGNTLMVN